jgi:hypothetical protein
MVGGLVAGGGLAVSLAPRLLAQTRDDAVHVCAAPDGVLKLAAGPSCPAGQTSLYLATAGPLTAKDDKKPGDTPAVIQKRIADLEKRIADLEAMAKKGELGNRVTAPFVVVDETGRPIFQVVRDQARLYDSNRKVVVAMGAVQGGGVFQAITPDGTGRTSFGAIPGFSGVEIRLNEIPRVQLGQMPSNRAELKFLNGSGTMVAAIGQDKSDQGGAAIMDSLGNYKAELQLAPDRKGELLIIGGRGKGVAALTEGSYGGNLSLWDVDGTGMVDAGVTSDGIGIVRTGPNWFKPGMGVLGLPGSYIVGKR